MQRVGEGPDVGVVDPRREAERLSALWRRAHRGTLHPHRDTAAFLENVEDAGGSDWFFAVRGRAEGYLRLWAPPAGTLEVGESVFTDPEDEAGALRAAARLAIEAGKPALEGWMAPTPFVREWFAPKPRTDALPMLRGAPPHAAAWFWPPDHF